MDDPVVMIAGLCDALKRLERAIEMDNMDDRHDYLELAKEKRQTVERSVMRFSAAKHREPKT